jgi:hypothetical protein
MDSVRLDLGAGQVVVHGRAHRLLAADGGSEALPGAPRGSS